MTSNLNSPRDGPVKIFYSYAHEDKTLREELGKHLSSFRYRGICQDWYDGEIGAGDEWDEEIKEKLRIADFILLLVSADFLFSRYIREIELGEAMRRHQAKEVRVIPIVLRPCDFTGEVFSKLDGLPSGMKAVTKWRNQDEAWTDVVKGLALEFEKFRKERPAPNGFSGVPPTGAEPKSATPRPDGVNEGRERSHELAETSARAFHGLSELMANPRIKAFVAEQQGQLVAVDEALQLLVDYKNVHDMLHDLQFKCYNYVFQEGQKLEDQIDWPLLVQPAKDLKTITQSLEEAAKQKSLADEDFLWLDQLRAAGDRLSTASNELSHPLLNEAAKLVKSILEVRPTVFDTKLCAAAKTLPLDELRGALCAIRDKLNASSLNSDAATDFSAGVDALPELSANLQALTTEHTRWQVIATSLWSTDALIGQDFTVLRNRWPHMRERLAKICGGNDTPWALSVLGEARKLDELLNVPPPTSAKELRRWQMRVRQTYTSCSNEGDTRFYLVDLSLKRLCDQLRELQAALVTILRKLL